MNGKKEGLDREVSWLGRAGMLRATEQFAKGSEDLSRRKCFGAADG